MVFAQGCSFYKLVWIFIIGAFLGDVAETLFCRWKTGRWMSRSSVVWGSFSIVWGGSITMATLILYRYREASESFLFVAGALLGGLFEYFCSLFTEKMFGKVFWDYSKMKYNLRGRINLLYCIFWGMASVIWFKGIYPGLSGWIERIPIHIGVFATWLMFLFMTVDMVVSGLALMRSNQRTKKVKAGQRWQKMMDKYFDDEKLHRIYPNAISVDSQRKDNKCQYNKREDAEGSLIT